LSFGGTNGCPLLFKLVKPIKLGGSWSAHEFRINQRLSCQAKSEMGTAGAAVHGKANPAVRQELARFDLACRFRDEPAKILSF